jgi:hypothetical protein
MEEAGRSSLEVAPKAGCFRMVHYPTIDAQSAENTRLGTVSNVMEPHMTRRFLLLLFGLSVIVIGTNTLALVAHLAQGLTISVSQVERSRYGYLITVEIINASGHKLYLPQAPGWRLNSDINPRVQSLDIEQWSDGKTNLLPAGRSLSSSLPPKAGYFSVGPCRDIPFDEHWIPLNPGEHIKDQIEAFEPDQHDFIPSSCTWRHARLLGQLRISVAAFRTAHIKLHDSVTGSVDFPVPQH